MPRGCDSQTLRGSRRDEGSAVRRNLNVNTVGPRGAPPPAPRCRLSGDARASLRQRRLCAVTLAELGETLHRRVTRRRSPVTKRTAASPGRAAAPARRGRARGSPTLRRVSPGGRIPRRRTLSREGGPRPRPGTGGPPAPQEHALETSRARQSQAQLPRPPAACPAPLCPHALRPGLWERGSPGAPCDG